MSQKLDFLIDGLKEQKKIVQQLQTDVDSLRSEVSSVNEQLSVGREKEKETRGSGRRKVPNEVSVSKSFS